MQEANVGLIIPIFASFVTLQCRFSQRLRAIVNVLTSNTYLALLCVAAGNTRNKGRGRYHHAAYNRCISRTVGSP